MEGQTPLNSNLSIPVPTTSSQMPPIMVTPAKKKWKLSILLLVVLLIIVGGILGYRFISFSKAPVKVAKSPAQASPNLPVFALQKVDSSPKAVEEYFSSSNFNSLLSVIYQQLPDHSWLLNIEKPIVIVYFPISTGSPAELLTSRSILCRKAGSNECTQYNFSQNYYIALDIKQKQAQPYVRLAYIVRILRGIYSGTTSTTIPQDMACTKAAVEGLTWEAKFWQSLEPDERVPINGFDNSGIEREEAKVNHYLLGKPDQALDQITKSRCVQDYTTTPTQASNSAQIISP